MEEDLQSKINAQSEKSQVEMLWGKPANDILNGRDNSASAKPIRAIWEMVQNARDVSKYKCNIVFTRKKDCFEFKHDGMPFTNDTLNALILQTSAKSRNDGDQVGQYGTGFLTTHKFGRVFHLSGSLKLVDDEELYYNFPKLIVDRSPITREEMANNLDEQFREKKKWCVDLNYRSKIPEKWTVFTYLQPNEIEKKNVEEAFEQAPELIPYVLCLNEGIDSITLCDEITSRSITYKRGTKSLVEDSFLSNRFSTDITIEDGVEGEKETFGVQTLESKKNVITKKGIHKTMVTVILPVRDKIVYQPSNNIARLFISLPLVGTEEWGVNFIFHAPLFTCTTDDRNSLRLTVDGQTKDDPAAENRQYIQEATDMIFDYINLHASELSNVHFFAPINFDVTNANNELSDYYKMLKSSWLQKMCNLPLVSVETERGMVKKTPSNICVLNIVLAKAIKENEKLLMPFYNIINRMHEGSIPAPGQLLYWCDIFNDWYKNGNCPRIIDIGEIVEFIALNGMTVVNETDLLIICEYLRDSEQLSFFDKNILLTEDGNTLTNQTEGYKSDIFCDKLKSCIKTLLPEYASKFVKREFSDLIPLPSFGNKNFKDAFSSRTEELQMKVKIVSDAAKISWATTGRIPDSTDGVLKEEQRNALMDYCRMVIPRISTSFQANALELVREYYDYYFDFSDKIDPEDFDWRSAIRTLLCNVFTEFTVLSDDKKFERKDWVRKMIACVHAFSDFNGILQNYRIYLSQSDEFRYCNELKKDLGIPEKMKDIYNIITSTDVKKNEIRKKLFDTEFSSVAITDATYEVVLLGKEIMEEILKSGKYINEIDSYEHKDLIIDIINYIDNKSEGNVWRNAFETIYKDIPMLLAKLVLNEDNREPMIKIMKVEDKVRLNKVAEIVNDENMIYIWEMGKNAWIEKQNELHDFEKKKELGEYVEEYIRLEMKDILAGYEIKVDVDDVQYGQDIIIYVNNKPIYYIEVKSRWKSADSVMMSAMQLDRSVEKKDCYSLFAVDMVGYNSDNVKEHIYPSLMDKFVDRIRVVANIGELNEEIIPTKRNSAEQVHIGGDYKAIVPQNLILNCHISFKSFMDEVLKPKVVEVINSSRAV